MNMILRTHWDPDEKQQTKIHTLLSNINFWNQSNVTKNNPQIHQIRPIAMQSYTSRILLLFYTALQQKGKLSKTNTSLFERETVIDGIIRRLSYHELLELVSEVRTTAFTLKAWNGVDSQCRDQGDIDFQTMCRLLQQLEIFKSFHQAIKAGDVGLIRYLIDPLIILYHGAEQFKYGKELLYYRWYISPTNKPALQQAILASGIIN